MKRIAWKKIEERSTNEKFPKCIKTLLISAGYDTFASLSQLSDDTIKSIEKFHQEKRSDIDSLNCCYSDYYKTLAPFGFLPGHKAILLNIPNQIREIQGEPRENPQCNSRRINFEAKKSLADEDLIKILVANLGKYIKKKSKTVVQGDLISPVLITDFKRGENTDNFVCKCIFSCPFCAKEIPAVYKTYWHSSNISLHLKKHI